VNKGWSILFGVVLLATFLIWVVAPFFGWWLPDNVSSFGGDVDYLFYVILGFTGFFFVLTEVILVYAMYRFVHRRGEKSEYTHGNHRLEILWTIVPAGILLFIAFAQISAWEKIKYQSRFPAPDLTLQVTARQWEWRMRYPLGDRKDGMYVDRFTWSDHGGESERNEKQLAARAWAETYQQDDVHVPNELHVWKGARVKVFIKTLDVLHSFTLPNLRLKQDTLPGKTIPIWFQVTRDNTRFVIDKNGVGRCVEPDDKRDAWEISCQELCGGRHYAMRGRLYVHPSVKDYQAWLDYTWEQQQSRGAPPVKPVALAPAAGSEPAAD
jgi:cytochrome c oxidase subunit 2